MNSASLLNNQVPQTMWLLHPPKSRRRWHVFTWLAALPALVFVALVQVAGVEDRDHQLLLPIHSVEAQRANKSAHPWRVEEHLHGWPTPWLRRAQGFGEPPWREDELGFSCWASPVPDASLWLSGHPLSWSARKAWPGDSDRQRIYPLGILVNLLVAGLVLGLPMTAVEFWLRRRGGFWRFKIVDFLAVVLVFAAVLGFYRWDQATLQQERQTMVDVFGEKGLTRAGVDYVGPDWLARLIGNRLAVPVMHRHNSLRLYDIEPYKEDLAQLANFGHLRRVTVYGKTGDVSIMAALKPLPRIEQIEINGNGLDDDLCTFINALPQLRNLKQVVLNVAPLREDLDPLKRLPRLKEITFDPEFFSDDELAQLQRELPGAHFRFLDLLPPVPHKREAIALHRLNRLPASNCTLSPQATILRWQGVPFTASHLEPLSRVIPKIHELILVDAELTPGEWPDLSQFTSLVELSLGVRDLPLEFMQQVARRPQLNTLKLKRRPSSREPLLALRLNPPRKIYVDYILTEEETAQLREAFGDRLQLGTP